MRVLVPLGTRPEIVKLSPVVAALRSAGIDVTVVATGQHADPALSDDFFRDLALVPEIRWTLDGDADGRVGDALARALAVVRDVEPDVVVVLGDTWTVPLFCLAARRSGVPVAHVEAGLRSFNPTSMEEVNRQVAGALAALHFAPTPLAARFLTDQGVDRRRVHVVGNPIVDVLARTGVTRRPVRSRAGVVVTAHRATNVDDPARLKALVDLVGRLADEVGPVTFPMHPRTRDRVAAAGLDGELRREGVTVTGPLPWRAMLDLVASSRVVVSDSGGLQEEASFLGVPVVVLRRSTPRWEGVEAGTAILTGVDADAAAAAAARLARPDEQERVASVPCLYGDGRTSERVAAVLADPTSAPLLAIDEPDFVDRLPPW